MSDTWNEIQEFKTKRSSLREKLLKRRKENEGLVADLTGVKSDETVSKSEEKVKDEAKASKSSPAVQETKKEEITSSSEKQPKPASPAPSMESTSATKLPPLTESSVERKLLRLLSDVTLELPLEFGTVMAMLGKALRRDGPESTVRVLLDKFSAQSLLSVSKDEKDLAVVSITKLDHTKIGVMLESVTEASRKRRKEGEKTEKEQPAKKARKENSGGESVESLLSAYSSKERETKKVSDEVQALLSATTAKEKSLVEKFRSQGGSSVMEFCQHGTKEDCCKTADGGRSCKKLHFKKIINKHTDESLGDCSFLNTCFHMDTCKYVHYEIEKRESSAVVSIPKSISTNDPKSSHSQTTLYPNQWIQCDLRDFDMSVLGKCAVVMADPPWDIHMELPYGTMGDDEMRALDVPSMQDDGYMFLWVTGRAMELGRECLQIWGYERIDELIWVKTNQLQRIIRTGRTGHWLNHGKEHCLIGMKGNPQGFNRGLDADVIVAEVRATSHKPDEVYGIIERLAPGMRKVELFGRPHNIQPNWITLGNQLDGVKLLDPEIVRRFKERYPSGSCMPGAKT